MSQRHSSMSPSQDSRAISAVSPAPGFIFVHFLSLCDLLLRNPPLFIIFPMSLFASLLSCLLVYGFVSRTQGWRTVSLTMEQNNKDQLIQSLKTHRVNTITELRRIEKIFAYLDSAEVTEPMTSAWRHYVNSNNLLNELRGLTKRIPFSSECLDEAKKLVVNDPSSVRSWNYCWLVLVKMERE
jgi:hypothetical protein